MTSPMKAPRALRSSSSIKRIVASEAAQATGLPQYVPPIVPDGEEAGIIVRGEIELTVGNQCEVLGPGDGYYFSSQLPHRFRNLGKVDCEIVSSCTPPTF